MWQWPWSRRSSATTKSITSLFAPRQAVWTRDNTKSRIEAGYEQNVTVYACVMEVAGSAAGIDLGLFRRSGSKWSRVEQHALVELLARPNPFMTRQTLIEGLIAYLLLAGNSYLERVGLPGRAPAELWLLRPDRMRVIPGSGGELIAGYEHRVGSQAQVFAPEEILHQRLFAPLDDFYGMSPLRVAQRAVDADNAALAWNYNLLKNSARPPGALRTEASLSEAQFERLKLDIEDHYSGHRNAGRPMLLEGGLSWVPFAMNAAEMDWLGGRNLSKLEICQAFQVPPELIGDSEHRTYSNYQEARKSLYTETVLPLMDRLLGALNGWLVPQYGQGLQLRVILDDIEALQEDRDKKWLRIERASFLTVNEKRGELGYGPVKGGDVLADDFGVAAEEGRSLVAASVVAPVPLIMSFHVEDRVAQWRAVDRRRQSWERVIGRRARRMLEEEAGRVSAAIAGAGDYLAAGVAAEAAVDESPWRAWMATTWRAVGRSVAQRVEESFGAQRAASLVERVEGFLARESATRVVRVTRATKARIREELRASQAESETLQVAAARIERLELEEIIPNRSMVIARTEVGAASGTASARAAKEIAGDRGVRVEKEWVAIMDSRVRDSHGALDGTRQALDEPYVAPSGALLRYPSDPAGPAEEVIQCRCTEIYHTVEGGQS